MGFLKTHYQWDFFLIGLLLMKLSLAVLVGWFVWPWKISFKKNIDGGRTTILKHPLPLSYVTEGLRFYFLKENNQLVYTKFAVLSLSHPGKIFPNL